MYKITIEKIIPPVGEKTYEGKEEVYVQRLESLDIPALIVFINQPGRGLMGIGSISQAKPL